MVKKSSESVQANPNLGQPATEGRKKRDAPPTIIERILAMGSVAYLLLRGVRNT
jgi:hypothetical protein